MSLLAILPAFALTALILAMVPGQGVAMVLRQSLTGGPRAALASVAGNASGLVLWGLCSALGLSQIFAHSPLAYNLLKYLGVSYLGFLAIQTLVTLRRASGSFDVEHGRRASGWAAYRLGLFTNLTNVKATVFAVAFIPQFVPRHFALAPGIVILAVVQASVSTLWYSSLVLGVHRAARLLTRPRVRRWLTGISATGLLFLALVLLLSSPR